ncbi:hypothetical protein [Aestuariivirga sp.]|uniref:hypothetical protein n=1 Tax=Aestuariivirga sp. TaxID=2650926 RepID=UPI003BAA65EE
MKTPASKKKSTHSLELEDRFLDASQMRAARWTERVASQKPLAAQRDLEDFDAVSDRPANDDSKRQRYQRQAPTFVGSRYFWAAVVATIVFCLLFTVLMGFRSGAAVAALLRNPAQYSPFLMSIAVIAAIQWLFALSAHRQAASNEIWRRMMLVTQRLQEPSPLAEEANRKINASFERLFADIDSRMVVLDERTAALSNKITAAMRQSTESADVNISNMRSIVEASEVQREALQRTGVMISTEILPVISKLESTMLSLETISQNASGILESVGSRLQQSTRDLKACLEDFNRANHTVAPEIEKRMLKFESTITRLPEQLDATIGRLSPLSETIADAAMLSTANIEVIEQLSRDISSTLEKSRSLFSELGTSSTDLFQEAVESHAERFRGMLETIVVEETGRVAALSRELGFLAETATSVVNKLQQPVTQVSIVADRALANMNDSVNALDERIQTNLSNCVLELNDAASRLVSSVSREIEGATMTLQTRLAASSSDLVQRVNADTARFENLIGETAERSSSRLAAVIKDLPSVVAQRMETEIAKVDGSLKGSIVGLSDQMRLIIDSIPSRLSSMTRETLRSLESNLERSFEGVAQRSEWLNDQFRKNATETTETVLQSYVDFIFVAVDRLRKELDDVNRSFTRDLEMTLKPVQQTPPPVSLSAPEVSASSTGFSHRSSFATRGPEGSAGR